MREMKNSGIEWLEDIPSHWDVMPNKRVMKKKKEICSQYQGEDILSLTMNGVIVRDLNAGGKMPTTFDGYQRLTEGNLLMCLFDIDVTPRCIGLIKNTGLSSPAYSQFVVNEKGYAPYYYYYYLNLDHTKELLHMAKNLRHSLTEDQLGEIGIAVPPYAEQVQIVEFLERKLPKVDTLIANVKYQIEKLKAYKQSLITEVVTKGLDPNSPMKDSGVDVFPYAPQHWNVQKTITLLTMPITDGPHTTPELLPEGIPFVSAEAVSCGNGSIDFDHIRGYISQEFYDECCKKYVPQTNDIYMIKSGATTGRVSVVDTDRVFTIWSPLAVFRCNPTLVHFRFLYYFLQSTAFQRQVQFGWTYGTQQNIGMRTLERLKVFVPPIDDQYAIAECLDSKCAQVDKLIAIKQAKIEKLEQYKKSLIYEYVTGKKEVS